MTKVAVFGAGSWGTAFAVVLANAGNQVSVWGRRESLCESINADHENAEYLPGLRLPDAISATHDPAAAADGAEAIVLAVPSQSLRDNLKDWAGVLPNAVPLVSLMKGVEVGTTKRMSEVIAELTHAGPERIAVVSGPNLAREIAEGQPAASVVACADEGTAARLQKLCHSPTFRPYTNNDVIGCELGGACKNVVALAVGMAIGLGFGDNARASVITRGLAEIARLGRALGADEHTFSGLAGLGDLVATCSSPLSRNRTFGEKLGQGMTVAEIAGGTRQVAEGVKSCASISELAHRHDVEMPIIEHVTKVVAGEMTPKDMLFSLVSRSAKSERWG
jgi:glycerol-3-phosphate dehydrogenase (NAD(P)+)